ncbi:hypothetical protein FOZ63_017055 [Perkinsus olseni]|uniref:Uncharacterized protein n=1 Tax=Perkinsus olseni TaxID=32597 RepID=A0A7J6RP33_PEROL|nr:hypothetical protein FOZ63_017055 [Perkinsus olseni]
MSCAFTPCLASDDPDRGNDAQSSHSEELDRIKRDLPLPDEIDQPPDWLRDGKLLVEVGAGGLLLYEVMATPSKPGYIMILCSRVVHIILVSLTDRLKGTLLYHYQALSFLAVPELLTLQAHFAEGGLDIVRNNEGFPHMQLSRLEFPDPLNPTGASILIDVESEQETLAKLHSQAFSGGGT